MLLFPRNDAEADDGNCSTAVAAAAAADDDDDANDGGGDEETSFVFLYDDCPSQHQRHEVA